jgi:hypothetical protein
MPLATRITVTCDAGGRCAPWRFVGVVTTPKKATSHVERPRGSENTGRAPTADLIGNVVSALGESWRPATRNGL